MPPKATKRELFEAHIQDRLGVRYGGLFGIFVFCNNGMYRVLKVNFEVYQREILHEVEPAGRHLLYADFPTPFDIAAIARSMGVQGERIVDPREIKPAVDRAVASGKPALLDMVIDGSM